MTVVLLAGPSPKSQNPHQGLQLHLPYAIQESELHPFSATSDQPTTNQPIQQSKR